jgi:hypothetical protein
LIIVIPPWPYVPSLRPRVLEKEVSVAMVSISWLTFAPGNLVLKWFRMDKGYLGDHIDR